MSAILSMLCVVGVARRYQSFTKLGTFHQHVSYASVGVSFDFGPFSEYVTSIVKSLGGGPLCQNVWLWPGHSV